MARWPEDLPGAWLTSSGDGARARWTILGVPSGPVERVDPLALLNAPARRETTGSPHAPPFDTGWIGWIAYELGERIESAAVRGPRPPADDRGWPVCHLVRCEGALVHDAATNRWTIAGDAYACAPALEAIRRGASPRKHPFTVGPFASMSGRDRYARDVQRVVDLIHAGDVFQVNLAHRLSAPFEGSTRALFARLVRRTRPWFGAYIELPDDAGGLAGAVCSTSPELFLRVRNGRVETRPMKGTRPRTGDPEALRTSEKDRAELAMIVDLMRNDLGRVCEFGSVRVDEPQRIEAHHGGVGGVWQGVATVSGLLRHGVSHADLLRAAFPPGSVTGAPKVRAMQIIRELEPVRRGPYCGAIGFVSARGDAAWNVAIRTAALRLDPGSTACRARGTIDYAIGAGIVADSDPGAEWLETLTKAEAFRMAVQQDGGP